MLLSKRVSTPNEIRRRESREFKYRVACIKRAEEEANRHRSSSWNVEMETMPRYIDMQIFMSVENQRLAV